MRQQKSSIPPFLKWAGGKRWLAERHSDLFDLQYDRYIEPFLGSGAIYFRLLPKRSLLSDCNSRLIETYQAICDSPGAVLRHLRKHHRAHCEEYYYAMRDSKPRSTASRAAQLIYLNRTCWNGLYRVNRNGAFNVPIGTKSQVILGSDDFDELSRVLASAKLSACDFSVTLGKAKRGDFAFVDPPYTVKHDNNGFIKYNEGLFSWSDQIRLRDCVVAAVERGATVLVTNANHASVRELYRGVGTHSVVQRASIIAGQSVNRKTCDELVIQCYPI